MTSRSRHSGFASLARLAVAVASAVLLGTGSLSAQGTTGKIEGTVRDQAGAPISGAQVLIVGTAFTATTNEQGYYFFNNVPSGVMTVRAQYIGYAPAEVRSVRVFSDQTFTVNLTLEQRAIEVAGITVTEERNPLVPRDQVASKTIIQGSSIENLPIDQFGQILQLTPGVVESNRGISIRGGRIGEAAVYIDGVLVRSTSGLTGTVTVGANALEEASITTGAIGAQYGDAQSGIISLVTRAGGPSFTGSLSYATDEVSGETYGTGSHRVAGSVGGPLARNLTFFLAGTLQGEQNPRLGKGASDQPIYVMNGIDTTVTVARTPGSPTSDSQVVALPAFVRYSNGARRPDDWSDAYTLDAKLQYSYGAGSRMSATWHRTRNQNLFYRGGNLYNPQAQSGERSISNALILNWTQNLGSRGLQLNTNFSVQSDEYISGPLDAQWFDDNRKPFGWFSLSNMQFIVDRDNFPVDERLIVNSRVNNCQSGRDADRPDLGGCIPFLNRNDLLTQSQFRFNPYGVTDVLFPQSGIGNVGINLNHETRVTGAANLDWQANRYNRVRLGGDFVRSTSDVFFSGLLSAFGRDVAHYTPTRASLFVTDRVDLGDVVIDLGLRYDRLNSGLLYPRVPGRVYTDPLRQGDLSRAYTAEDTLVANRCAAQLAAADTTSWSTCNYFEADARSVLSPSLGVSFPVTDRTGFRLSYAHQVQPPIFDLLATNVNSDLSATNTNDIFSRDLDFGKTIIFEFGVRHAFSDDMVLDISAYNKDKVSDVTARVIPIFDPFRNETQNVNLLTNADFGNVRGVDVRLDRRIGSVFQGSIAYTLQSARSTGSDPFEYINTVSRQVSNVTGDRAPPPQALLTTRDDRTHSIAGSLSLNFPHDYQGSWLLRNTGAFATFRFASGLAYTRMQNDGTGARGPGNNFGLSGIPVEGLNASRMPWIKNIDLRLTRGFRFGSRDLTVFADFRNLFNWTNLVAIFAETGNVTNSKRDSLVLSPIRVTLEQEAGNLVENRTVTTATGSQTVRGINLSNCDLYDPGETKGLPNCIMLRRTEERFGDRDPVTGLTDRFFTEAEQDRAFREFYNLNNGPYTFRGPGFNFRLGFELNF